MQSPLILIVDDNAENIKVLGSLLGRENFDVAVAINGQMAIDYVQSKKVDLILLDIMMPELDGFGVCRILKENPQTMDIPVIFITALDDIEKKVQAFTYGAMDYITKPFLQQEVLARVKVHIRLKQTLAELEEQSILDNLTKSYNRRYLDKMLSYHLALARRENSFLSICYFDLDCFKEINDLYGHSRGDMVLCHFASVVKEEIRRTDILFRLGGDEFIVLFPGLKPLGSEGIINRIKERLINSPSNKINILFSHGFALFDPANPTSMEKLILEADRNMYINKEARKA